ncbi:hypothetical protein AMTRI_Chr09g21970 [Amborella trichopoda]|uniref:LOB domain-containing protein n=1 Tax=Amborella trichopoda TaxID=13333 RepID=W1PTE3_AMBTC|nr:LOB domain-containing protein 18 [Amborella trichopoda]ERN13282.1 hypothetical protein AMTR_s00041p00044170 [Amborella trichopoda]|eukprot:XP_006851815.1 LOB domain-containing protein 18 [Amborella trichopoda]
MSSGGGGGGGGGNGPCGACKFLRRKCVSGCVFAPYFDSEQGAAHFAAVHKVFGASNVSKLLLHIPAHKRLDAVVTVCYEAQARLRDPVYGCVAHIFALQQQVMNLQAELAYMQAHLSTMELPPPPPPPPAPSQPSAAFMSTSPDLIASSSNSNFDLSALFDHHSHYVIDPASRFYRSQPDPAVTAGGAAGGELHALARELLTRRRSSPGPSTKALSN